MVSIKPENHNKPWSKDQIRYVAAHVPTEENCDKLAKILGRTEHAIQYMWCKLYMRTSDLKELAKPENDTKTQQYKMILEVRKETKIVPLW